MPGTLFVCATPIGNLEDASFRLVRTLGEAGLIAAEDTRRTRKLLARHGIHARMVSYHDANEEARLPGLLEHLLDGGSLALVTDAGTPGISDPGYRLVRACLDAGIEMEVLPGPSAAVAALVISGLATARFCFEGFLPRKKGPRLRRLAELASDERTLVVFEAPGRLPATLEEMRQTFGDRPACIARELTKAHQEVIRGSIGEISRRIQDRRLLGEVVVVVAGAEPAGGLEAALDAARRLVAVGATKARAAAEAASASGLPKREVYEGLVSASSPRGPSLRRRERRP